MLCPQFSFDIMGMLSRFEKGFLCSQFASTLFFFKDSLVLISFVDLLNFDLKMHVIKRGFPEIVELLNCVVDGLCSH